MLSVAKLADVVTSETSVQVNFGELVPADPAMRERFAAIDQQPPVGREAVHVLLSLILPAAGVEPYRVGSFWNLERSESGELTLRSIQ